MARMLGRLPRQRVPRINCPCCGPDGTKRGERRREKRAERQIWKREVR